MHAYATDARDREIVPPVLAVLAIVAALLLSKTMEGNYYTDRRRQTFGDVTLKFLSREQVKRRDALNNIATHASS